MEEARHEKTQTVGFQLYEICRIGKSAETLHSHYQELAKGTRE